MRKLLEIAYYTDRLNAMVAFYRMALGADPVAQGDGMAIFQSGDTRLFLHRTYAAKEGELPPENHLAIQADDVDTACAELLASGYTLEVTAADYYWGRSAYLRDPDGHLIELHAPSAG